MTENDGEPTSRDFVGSLAKGLQVITCFDAENDAMTVADVARRTGMDRAGARRILLTLHALGYVVRDGRRYTLGPKVLDLGFAYLGSRSWLQTATPFLKRLRDELHESVSVTTLDRGDVIYVARFALDRVMTLSMEIGSRKPAYCTAMGRVLLGELPEEEARARLDAAEIVALTEHTETDREVIWNAVRRAHEEGYALVDRELEVSLIAVSVPLRNSHGEVVAAINVCGHPSALMREDLERRCLPALLETTRRIERLLV